MSDLLVDRSLCVINMSGWSGSQYTWQWQNGIAWDGVNVEQVKRWAKARMYTMCPELGDQLCLDRYCSALANWAWTLRRGSARVHESESVIAVCVDRNQQGIEN